MFGNFSIMINKELCEMEGSREEGRGSELKG